jgi:type I restriction enzyme, S subunit
MPELAVKKGWTRVAFGDVVRQVQDRVDPDESGVERFVAGEHMDTDDLRIRRWGTIGNGYLGPAFHMRFKPGHVLYGSRRTYLRKVAVADFEGITANTTFVIESKDPNVLLPDLLPFIMQAESFHEHSKKQSKGSVNPYVNFSDLTWYEFALPPLEEQPRIADLAQTTDRAADTLVDLLSAARVAEVSLFCELVSRCGADEIALASLLTESPRNGCSATEASSPTGHWVLALSALTRWGYRRGELKPVKKTDAMLQRCLQRGDLLISRSNTRELVGLPGTFDENRSDVSWPDTMMRLTPDESRLRKPFLELFLRAPAGRMQVQSFAAGTSASMKKINGTNVSMLSIPLPSADVQDIIVSKTEAFRQARESMQGRLLELRELKRIMLGQALSPVAREGA